MMKNICFKMEDGRWKMEEKIQPLRGCEIVTKMDSVNCIHGYSNLSTSWTCKSLKARKTRRV
ncbi:hypothetical protein MTP09_06890 [Chryseobacterium suipulveris]|uniref:Uncharacterized protein n=1 Tax=Chryseobacterium suipulveris TaxID=2929800 RepID=A0ABY4BTZ0_9FLAO|nr:hypothetical protein [Chryseobacterium suipulveris]UOE42354.1 hypothetical protein MTP09_06890 [Chryseobacterium suipulveris]